MRPLINALNKSLASIQHLLAAVVGKMQLFVFEVNRNPCDGNEGQRIELQIFFQEIC